MNTTRGGRRLRGGRLAYLIGGGFLLGCLAFWGLQAGRVPTALPETTLGGETTAYAVGRNAFSFSARNLTRDERRLFEVGDSFFEQNWVTAPASTDARDGLGPTFTAASCSSCHTLDGRAKPPDDPSDPERGLVIQFSIPGPGGPSDPIPEPRYGDQLQDRAINGVPPEGRVVIEYTEVPGTYGDGEPYTLLKPSYSFTDMAFGPMPPDLQVTARAAPAVIGMGLLEAIPDSDILSLADPDDRDNDGISGRIHWTEDPDRGEPAVGRFGWKAANPTVAMQTVSAFHGDIGITSSHFPDQNCPPVQTECAAAPHGGTPEVPDERLAKVVFYSQTLAVPAMRNAEDRQVRLGARQFAAAGCQTCHVPRYVTGPHEIEALSGQEIFPYTDLLLHDMGEGLADHRPDGDASGREWRTAPLWGIGLVEDVNGHTRFLHDGRARNLAEAILWHGGEAEASREAFRNMPRKARAALLKFLESL